MRYGRGEPRDGAHPRDLRQPLVEQHHVAGAVGRGLVVGVAPGVLVPAEVVRGGRDSAPSASWIIRSSVVSPAAGGGWIHPGSARGVRTRWTRWPRIRPVRIRPVRRRFAGGVPGRRARAGPWLVGAPAGCHDARRLTVRSGSTVPRPRTATCFHQRLQRPCMVVVVVEAVHRPVAFRFREADFRRLPSLAASVRAVQPTAEGYTSVS